MSLRRPVEIRQLSIEEIFRRQNNFSIPIFQREYKWTIDKGLEDFWLDLTQHYENKERTEYHFGPIMVINETEGDPHYRVVDGQQRLTSTLLFFIVIRDFYLELGDEEKVKDIEELIYFVDDDDQQVKRIELSQVNSAFWNNHILNKNTLKSKMVAFKDKKIARRDKQLSVAYQYFGKRIQEWSQRGIYENQAMEIEKLLNHFTEHFTLAMNIISDARRAFKMLKDQ